VSLLGQTQLLTTDAAVELVGTGTKMDRARARIGTDAAAVRLRSGQELYIVMSFRLPSNFKEAFSASEVRKRELYELLSN
jgi:hypothetical protein